MKKARPPAGFTLIEVLVVIVLMGILFSIAAPGWLAFMNTRRANAARDEVLQALRQTQSEALRTRRSQTVQIETTPDPALIVMGTRQVLGNGQFLRGMIAMNSTVNQVTFDPDGNLDQNLVPPFAITVTAPAGSTTGAKRCVLVQTLLGAMRTGEGAECDAPPS